MMMRLRPQPPEIEFGEQIKWVKFDEALERNKVEKKPIFALFYSDSCRYCVGS